MKTQFSKTLCNIEPDCLRLIKMLEKDFDFVSILATDTQGSEIQVGQKRKQIGDYGFSERGLVVRLWKESLYREYSLNPDELKKTEDLANQIKTELDQQSQLLKKLNIQEYATAKMEEEEMELFVEKDVKILPESVSTEQIMNQLTALSNQGMAEDSRVLECIARFSYAHVSKMYLSSRKNLKQSYLFSQGLIMVMVRQEENTQADYQFYSGLKGAEIMDEMKDSVPTVVKNALDLLNAERVTPGLYDIITDPDVTGLIAHEAFGHGVEMDMFVKNRALGAQYLNQQIASELVEMHEGALVAESTASYIFDDEGTLAGDVTEIKKGILKTGIADALTAIRLGILPTGNGKRESFERKAYTRMTNTVFSPGENTLEEMISSISYGYLLEGMQSGMEDPKHWGIQCMLTKGREIKDGKLTGKIVAPVILTGYVPDLLKSISMASKEVFVEGSGYCGKGHKEWVKTADGGPYLKAKGRLG